MDREDLNWDHASQIEKYGCDPSECDLPECVVDRDVVQRHGDGERLVLTPETTEEIGDLLYATPDTIDELASWVGTPDDVAPRADDRPSQVRSPDALRAEIERIEDGSTDVAEPLPTGAFPGRLSLDELVSATDDLTELDKNPYPALSDAIEGYLFYDSSDFQSWKPALDWWVDEWISEIPIAVFDRFVVDENEIVRVSRASSVINAFSVIIRDGGMLEWEGTLRIDCARFYGE